MYATLPVPGSRRSPVAGTRRLHDADPRTIVHVTVVLRRDPAGIGSAAADLHAVRAFADRAGLAVVAERAAARSIRLAGTAAAMGDAFGVRLGVYESAGGLGHRFRGREDSAVYVPAELDGVVVAVLGLDSGPQARAHFRRARGIVSPRTARLLGRTPREIAAGYGFPSDVDGTGQTIAVIELGGGYTDADLEGYFGTLGLPVPTVIPIGVDDAGNAPGDDADGEVALDIQVIGAVAPGATIAVYFAPNTTDGFYDAIAAAVHDTEHHPSVISISWGQAEAGWAASELDAYDALFADAARAGITVYAAAGDSGSTDGVDDGELHVDFPASSPSVVGCGGTTLNRRSEVVWNGEGATGGGYSTHFGVPVYQYGVHEGDGRGVPDVAGDADPQTGYLVRVDGEDQVIGGTSAVAPLWAALTALANQRNGGAGAGGVHDRLYAAPKAFRDIVAGDNGTYNADRGWDPCTGLGSPSGEKIAATLK